MNGERMPIVDETMHMRILRSEDSKLTAVEYNIEKDRRTVYSPHVGWITYRKRIRLRHFSASPTDVSPANHGIWFGCPLAKKG